MEIYDKHYLTKKYSTLFKKVELVTINRLSNFFGQAQHESKLKPTVENLNYDLNGLLKNFSRDRISTLDAQKYCRTAVRKADQEKIANLIYGGAWGLKNLGNKVYGDGWKYRGRGLFQITGRANYEALTIWVKKVLGLDVDYVNNPDLLLNEADSLIGAFWYWSTRNLNTYADKNDILSISKIINLGNVNSKATPKGLEERKAEVANFAKLFKTD